MDGDRDRDRDALRSLPRFVYVATGVMSFANFSAFYSLGLITAMLLYIPFSFPLSWWTAALLVTSTLVGGMLGALKSGSLADRLGRLAATFAPVLWVLVLARGVAGIGIGLVTSLANLLVVELAPAERRGALATVPYFFQFAGTMAPFLTGFIVVNALDQGQEHIAWRLMSASGVAVSALELLAGWACLPESPRWLIYHGHTQEGLAVLARVYGARNHARLVQDYRDLAEHLAAADAASSAQIGWRALFRDRKHRRPVLVGLGLQMLRKLSGNAAVTFYLTLVLVQAAGLGRSAALLVSLLMYVPDIAVVAGVFGVLDRWGRKTLLLLSVTGLAFALLPMAVALTVMDTAGSADALLVQDYLQGSPSTAAAETPLVLQIIVVVSLFAQRCCYSLGLGPVPSIHTAESLPHATRARGLALALFGSWLAAALTTLAFPAMLMYWPASTPYWLFWAVAMLGIPFVWLGVRETCRMDIDHSLAHASPKTAEQEPPGASSAISTTSSPPCNQIVHQPTPKLADAAPSLLAISTSPSFESINLHN
jgi:MFS family permease